MSKPEIGAGDIEIVLDGETVVLKPSLQACQTLCRAPGGLYRASAYDAPSVADRLLAYDLDTMAMIIRAGLGLGAGAVKELEEKIYNTGLLNLRLPLSNFVGIVANGGRPPAKLEDIASPPDQAAG